jgi:hypothetical protein
VDEVPVRRMVWGGLAVAGLTSVWLAGLGMLALSYFTRMLLGPNENRPPDPHLGWLGFGTVAVLVGGPLVIALAAWVVRLDGVPRVYLVIAAVLVLPALYGSWISWNDMHPRHAEPSTPWTPPTHCVAYSGGSNTCPGG